jgi:hypothetical protein
VFDLPHVVDGLQGSENLKYVGGDMFEAIPPTQSILLKVKCSNFVNVIFRLKYNFGPCEYDSF